VTDGRRTGDSTWTSVPGSTRSFSVGLPEGAQTPPGRPVVWTLSAWNTRGQRFDVIPEPGVLREPGAGSLVLDTNRNGGVVVSEWARGAAADVVRVSDAGVVTIA